MNPELFSVPADEPVESALRGILAMGITAAPVLDADRRPLGLVSLRDLIAAPRDTAASGRMSSPPVVIGEGARITEAARRLAATGLRHLVVVDGAGRAVGMVSAVDLVRGLIGFPAQHPAAFPHLDAKTGAVWTDDAVLDGASVDAAPAGPGWIVLSYDAPGVARQVVWVEWAESVFTRLTDMLSLPQENPELARWLESRAALRFRIGMAHDGTGKRKAAAAATVDTRR
jgi:CBS domain-containing protein